MKTNINNLKKIGAVILAAGKGTRLGCTDIPKVMLEIEGKPLVGYSVETLEAMGLSKNQICLVVGFKKEKVEEYFKDRVIFAHQEQQKGTAHAAYIGIKALPNDIETVLVMGGDDSAFYTKESLLDFINKHVENNATLSLLTAHVKNPDSLGRIVRHVGNDKDGDVEIIEKEYLTLEQKEINEISTGTFVFNKEWYLDIFPDMPQLRKLGEFGLPTALAMARNQNKKYQMVTLKDGTEWHGVNTPEQLEEAKIRKA